MNWSFPVQKVYSDLTGLGMGKHSLSLFFYKYFALIIVDRIYNQIISKNEWLN